VPSRHLRIGTRGSPMALRQTTVVHDRLVAAHPELAANGAVEIVTIRTAGDRVPGPAARRDRRQGACSSRRSRTR
jgi:hydroxymethylbilane synthase